MKKPVIMRPITAVFPILRFAIDRGAEQKKILGKTNLNEKSFLDSKTSKQ